MQQARLSENGALDSSVKVAPLSLQSPVSALTSAELHQKTVRLGTVEPPVLALLKHWSKPLVLVIALLCAALVTAQAFTAADGALALVTALFARQLFSPLRLLSDGTCAPAKARILRLMLESGAVFALLLGLGFALKLGAVFPRDLLVSWFALTPVLLVIGDYWSMRALARTPSAHDRHIIIGVNELGVELARRISDSVAAGTFMGFFDFRSPERLPQDSRQRFAGQCKDVAAFVRTHGVNAIYIALPMSNAPRIEEMLQELRDTTASIYFVPDIFAFDLVQGRYVEINGIPMLSICDTPFHGMHAVTKRATDIVLASLTLFVAWPVMLAAAVAVKLSSPGPVLFKQRRYGLHG